LEELSQLKYAGYTHLIRTIDLEANDPNLFSQNNPRSGKLLSAAIELCYWTLRSSALNAEQVIYNILRDFNSLKLVFLNG
jgi:DnaJ family protein C protein 13